MVVVSRDRKRRVLSWSKFFWCTLFVVFGCIIFTLSTFRHLFGGNFHPVLGSTWRSPEMKAVTVSVFREDRDTSSPGLTIRDIVTLPDQVLVFLKYPVSSHLLTKDELDCAYFVTNSSRLKFRQPPLQISDQDIVRCPPALRGTTVSIMLKSEENVRVQAGPSHRWDSLAYEAMLDHDNTTIVFVKGLNLRPERLTNGSRFECVYGWDFRKSKFILRAEVMSIAQEIVRCKTPLSVLKRADHPVKVSIRIKGKGILHSIARLQLRQMRKTSIDFSYPLSRSATKQHQMCVCTMVRNQARFLKEWVIYHAHIGVERWFIYDNNSDDDIDSIIESLVAPPNSYIISKHIWPWIKSQEGGFAHCALRAREFCEWVGFIDVDEFFHVPSVSHSLHNVLRNFSDSIIAEIRTSCFSFGPSGHKTMPEQGVMVGYTCRLIAPERHKSIVRPDALNSTLINVVHHFHLRNGYRYINIDRSVLAINHYKYQVWEVFKEKFYRRVATYVADWQDEQNVGSKDRAPGLGTKAVEPVDWSSRFCEVNDTGLREHVIQMFADQATQFLPWQAEYHHHVERRKENRKRKRRRKEVL
ncbi:hypothetical protein ACFE04_010026 [Oxalis oulophora]